jgi:N-acetyl-anhydromuramyl-L-alanine amidase AmpD
VLPVTDVQQRREIIEKLRWFDMVKFAKYTPTMAASEEAAAWLEALLQRYGTQASTPQEEPQEVQDA